jgi:hypothetical protein
VDLRGRKALDLQRRACFRDVVKALAGRRVATVPRLFQIKLRVPPVPRIWGPVLNAIQNLSSYKIAVSLFEP